MPDRIDRRIGGNGVLFATVLVIFFIAAAAGTYVWMRMTKASPVPLQAQTDSSVLSPRSDDPLSILACVPANGMLSLGALTVKRQADSQAQAREILAAALADQRMLPVPVLNELKVRAFFLDQAGTGYVDLAASAQGGIRASARDELLAVYALVNMLTQNLEEIRQVRFLIDGRESQTLAGHIDLSRTFTKRMDLIKQ